MKNDVDKSEAEVEKTKEETQIKRRDTVAKWIFSGAEIGMSIWSFKKLLQFEEIGSIGSRSFATVWTGVSKLGKVIRRL